MLQIIFALLAGILTIGAPCILPLLPILLGTSVGQRSKTRPIFIVAGFVMVFAVLGVFLSFLTTHIGISAVVLRNCAIALLAIFGVLLIWPKPFEILTLYLNPLINRVSQVGQARQDDWGGFLLGMTLGVIWTPCAGPVLGTILTLIASQKNFGLSLVLLTSYAIGAGVPMLIIAYGSQYVTTQVHAISKYAKRLQQVFGVLIILLAVAMYYGFDVLIENQLTAWFPATNLETHLVGNNNPQQQNNSSNAELVDYGQAPDFVGVTHWLNSDPLTISSLKGKVVLVDFWTFSCINCIRTLPYVTKWYDTYKDQGFVVVGVHTPEFAFEKDTNNVASAIKKFNIHYPVAQDNDYKTWNNYNNQYWPAEYLIDKNGDIEHVSFGEGDYNQTENAIRQLLGLSQENFTNQGPDLSKIASPEMYFGTMRLANLASSQQPSTTPKDYSLPDNLNLNTFALEGRWQFSEDKASLVSGSGKIKLHFNSAKVHFVSESTTPLTVSITVDGQAQPPVTIQASQLYTLFDSTNYADHTIEIIIPNSGLDAFTFTFG
jgi:cytochrome c biogenesis protein CcdA/thiol-disulfide isomerase/thioredoxin